MNITIEIDDKYKSILSDLSKSQKKKTISNFIEAEILDIITANLEDYGYDENCTFIHAAEKIEATQTNDIEEQALTWNNTQFN